MMMGCVELWGYEQRFEGGAVKVICKEAYPAGWENVAELIGCCCSGRPRIGIALTSLSVRSWLLPIGDSEGKFG